MAGKPEGAAMRNHLTMIHYAKDYLKYRRSLGFVLRSHGRLTMQFARFVDRHHRTRRLTIDLMLGWVNDKATYSPSYRAHRLSAVRGFACYLAARDGQTPIPAARLLSVRLRRCRPHIYSPRQLRQLLAAAGRLHPHYKLRPLTYQTLLGLLAATGLRISEAVSLTRGQADLDRGLLQITQTKFKKSRVVPLHSTTIRALRHYRNERDRHWGVRPEGAFFLNATGKPIPTGTVDVVFRQLCERLGWQRGNGDLPKPRLHDLRHTFACRCLLIWHRNGQDIAQRMAALATYLGHSKVSDTYWYLTGTAELLAIAGNRFGSFADAEERNNT